MWPLIGAKEVGDCRYHAKKKKNPKHSNKEGAVLLETDLYDLYVSCKLIYLHEYRQK